MSDGVVGTGVMTALAPRLSPTSEKVSVQVLSGLESIDTPLLLITTALLFGLLALTNAPTQINAILFGGLMLPFWIGVVGIGIVLPLILAYYVRVVERKGTHEHEKVNRLMLITFSLVLIGALLLRYVLIIAGQVIG
jgi:formate-dependent nitrite reductase membrane component NrfD